MKIICIGMNYHEHIKELNSKVPEVPVFFLKADSALLRRNQPFFLPDFSNDVHYEIEVAVKIKKVGRKIEQQFAHRYYDEIGLGLDITARDLQQECRKNGLPWEICKSFDDSAPLGKFINKNIFSDIQNLSFCLTLNDQKVQEGNTSDMIFSFDHIVSHVSQYLTLKTGDVILTGTPPGVGPMKQEDVLKGYLEGQQLLELKVK
jgi:2-keto-4-pentenoate hydratase/2-oxohepta-3-ene-1,7-dioic acid hydratase in catechol pathway